MSAYPAPGNKNLERMLFIVIGAAVAYQALLCLIDTHAFNISRTTVGVAEGMILLACIPFMAQRVLQPLVLLAIVTGFVLLLIMLVKAEVDLKAVRDLLIPLWFYWLGRNIGSPELADKLLKPIIGLILLVGAFEMFALETYTDVFDIFAYYVNIGSLEADSGQDMKLALNGLRPDGVERNLLPWFLESHRVSSVFLEPVSLGNFATVLAAWGLAKDGSQMKQMFLFVGAAVLMTILSDSRFALLSIGLLVGLRLVLKGQLLYLPALLPLVVVPFLIAMSAYTDYSGDNLPGRLVSSGEALVGFDAMTLFGFEEAGPFPDQGFAHVFSSFGLLLSLLLWVAIWLLPMRDQQGQRFRSFVAVYVVLILSISGTSLFALKSAGALWFLVGCATRKPAPLPTWFSPRRGRSPVPPVSAQFQSQGQAWQLK